MSTHSEVRPQEPLALTADHFTSDPLAQVNVLLQTISAERLRSTVSGRTTDRSGRSALACPRPRTRHPVRRRLPGLAIQQMYQRLHSSIELVALDDVHVLTDKTNTLVTVWSTARFRHLDQSEDTTDIKAYLHVDLSPNQIQSVESTVRNRAPRGVSALRPAPPKTASREARGHEHLRGNTVLRKMA